MNFFIRASILQQVDGHIMSKRESMLGGEAKEDKALTLGKSTGDVFSRLVYLGIEPNLVKKLFEYFNQFEFQFTSSVGQRTVWASVSEQNSYDLLREIDLYDHTLRVVENCLNDPRVEENQRPIVGLFALLHDTGKSQNLCDYFGIEYGDGHERASAEFIEIILHDTPYQELGVRFAQDLMQLHRAKNEGGGYKKLSFFGASLHRADALAREQELRKIEGN